MDNLSRHFVIGTAGHIDHGKTSLVKNLTGKDTDWLKEEKERGMTIDLGFAFLGDHITIIDVPGHERFVRTMVAGISTIDLVLFVIAADDGIMPQTNEHLEILNLLQIPQGIIVITKIDNSDPEWTELVIDDITKLVRGTFLEQAPIIRISNVTGEGLNELKQTIIKQLEVTKPRKDKGVFRMPIDRVFMMKGFGTVVAGTVLSGTLTPDRMVELLPQGLKLRVRGLQIHEKKVERVAIGDRAAVNLIGVEKHTISRGNVLAEPEFYRPTRFVDAKLYLLKSATRNLKNRVRVRIHIGTSEVLGRVIIIDKDEITPGDPAFVQFRLEQPTVADNGDQFVVRSYSPIHTIGGGRILATHPRRHKRFTTNVVDKLSRLHDGDVQILFEQHLLARKFRASSLTQMSQTLSISEQELEPILNKLIAHHVVFPVEEKKQKLFLHQLYYEQAKQEILQAIEKFHFQNPTKKGINKTELKVLLNIPLDQMILNVMLKELSDQKHIKLYDNKIALTTYLPKFSDQQKRLMQQVEQIYFDQKFITPNIDELAVSLNKSLEEVTEVVEILSESNQLMKLDDGIFLHRENINEANKILIEYFRDHKELTVGDCRQLLNTSRKYTVPLLNYFDAIGLTVRQQDIRVFNTAYKQ